VREHGGGSLTGDSEGKIKRDILSERNKRPVSGYFFHRGPVVESGGDSLAGTL